MHEKKRLDIYLAEKGMTRSRSEAKDYIERGLVYVNGMQTLKMSHMVGEDDEVEIKEYKHLVSRAGEKLLYALEQFKIDVNGAHCLDIGSSTGGFTQVLLESGAKSVTAVDVGTDQFDRKLYEKWRDQIYLHESIDIRDYAENYIDENVNENDSRFSYTFDCIVCDASFISLEKIIPSVVPLMHDSTQCVFLLKPQFEVGKGKMKKGIVKNEEVYKELKEKYVVFCSRYALLVNDIIDSPILGGDGNKEFLMYATKTK